jgi:hypothetical protein
MVGGAALSILPRAVRFPYGNMRFSFTCQAKPVDGLTEDFVQLIAFAKSPDMSQKLQLAGLDAAKES